MIYTPMLLEYITDLKAYTIDSFTAACKSLGMNVVSIPFCNENHFGIQLKVYKNGTLINTPFCSNDHLETFKNELDFLHSLYVVDKDGSLAILG